MADYLTSADLRYFDEKLDANEPLAETVQRHLIAAVRQAREERDRARIEVSQLSRDIAQIAAITHRAQRRSL